MKEVKTVVVVEKDFQNISVLNASILMAWKTNCFTVISVASVGELIWTATIMYCLIYLFMNNLFEIQPKRIHYLKKSITRHAIIYVVIHTTVGLIGIENKEQLIEKERLKEIQGASSTVLLISADKRRL